MSKPTMQDIADALSVSRITVWKALSNRPGVGLFSHFISGFPCDHLCSTASSLTHGSGSRVPTGVLSFLDANHPSDCQGSFQA